MGEAASQTPAALYARVSSDRQDVDLAVAASRYLLSGLVRCERCRKALTAAEAKGSKYSYYVCQSILNGGSKSCEVPRLNAGRFERLIIEQMRCHILTESNIRELAKRRELLDGADVIARFVEEMGEFPQTSEVTETRSFIRSFVKRIVVRPGRAVIHYSIPMPHDSPLGGGDESEMELGEGVRSMVPFGRPRGTVLRTFVWEVAL